MASAALALVLALGGCSAGGPAPRPSSGPDTVVDLVGGAWQDVPGVVADGDGLRVTATGRSIVQQDGSGGQSNPPVDLAGTHLEADGDFSIRFSLSDVTSDATVSVLDAPPVVADEFRIEPAGVHLSLRDDDLRIAVFDGSLRQDVSDPEPVVDRDVTLADPEAEISLTREGDRLVIASGGRTLASLPRGGVLGSGRLWLGLSSRAGSFRVDSFDATAPRGHLAAAGPAAAEAERSPDGLQALASAERPGFLVGAAVAMGPLASDADYADAVVGNVGALTPENAMKPQALSPRQGEYTFEEADALLDLAEAKGIAVHGHTIAFSEAMPRWMQELPAGTAEERRASGRLLLDYLHTVVTHFAGRLHSLDVVNEPFDVDQGTDLQQNTWYRVFGPTYPAVVSRAVHDADPDVEQFINENGADVPGPRQDALLRLARDTNARGGHIDGVGLQAHVYDLGTDRISAADLRRTLENVRGAGLVARISENDVPGDEGDDVQAEQYATVLATCMASPTCVAWTTWGVDDRYDWWLDDQGRLRHGHDLLFDDGEPTPAYDAIKEALSG